MKPITAPINRESSQPDIANLQSALLFLLERDALPVSREERPVFVDRLRRERQAGKYDSGTRKLVMAFQDQNQLGGNGFVDERSAEVLNSTLREVGAFDAVERPGDSQNVVVGRVAREDGEPLARGTVRAFHEEGRASIRLGSDVTDGEGRYTIHYLPLPDLGVVNLRVAFVDETGATVQSSDIIPEAGPLEVVDLIIPFVQAASPRRRVEGRILFDHGAPAENLSLRLYQLAFGGPEKATLLSETTTLEHGVYSLAYDTGDQPPQLEVRALGAAGQEIALSTGVTNPGPVEVLNLVAPAELGPLGAEFTRLAGDLSPQVGGQFSLLRSAREDSGRQDLTVLHEATGWDARLIATAAMATKLSQVEETGLPEDVLYALLRAGMPSDRLHLARVSGTAFDLAVDKARAAGVVDLSDDQVAQARRSFETFSVDARLAVQAPGSSATYGDLLKKLDLDPNEQQTFAKLYLDHRGDAKSLWEKAAAAGLGAVVPKLQKQGKLAFLTTNNPELTAKLQEELGDASPARLVTMGLYKKEPWLERIDSVPPAFSQADDPKQAYGREMARRVRISYSTEVAWDMIKTGELSFGGGNANLASFLQNAIGKGFKLGQTPIDAFIKSNPEVFDGIDQSDRATTREMVKTLQRVYQITPGNDSMKALLSAGLLSAQDVLAYPLDQFLDRFVELFPSEQEARLVYRKAEQVGNITTSLFGLAKELDGAPPVFAMSAPQAERAAAKQNLITHFPTMENLFGSLDYCECDHCRSVLSPAAYLVDLLQFLDREPKIWENTLRDWEKKHGDAPYPFKSVSDFNQFRAGWLRGHPGGEVPDSKRTPYQILTERRPDLPHIPLTCENTNTALPQIDLVNEILEYYVTHNALKAESARDTGDATTSELLAEPQYVMDEAYTALRQARYPLALPFDLWLETARRFADYFGVPLWRLLEVFRRSDDLFAPGQIYDRAAICFESLELSPAEVAIYTDPDPLPNWFRLYGFSKEDEALTEAFDNGQRIDLNSAKALSRRLAVSYKELLEIVGTGFVNPQLAALVTLRKLQVETTDLFFYQRYQGLLDEAEADLAPIDRQRLGEVKAFEGRLDALTAQFRESGAAFDARVWLQSSLQAKAFDAILVLADPDAGCDFDQTTLRYANGDAVDPIALLKINLFVRLWRKLGWSIEETDRALQAFVPKNAPFDKDNLAKTPLRTALVQIAHLRSLEERLQLGKGARLKLLTLWGPMATTGANPLYRQLFLKRNILKSDPVFDDPLGRYLSDPDTLLRDHLLALQGALGLSAGEIDRVLADNGLEPVSARLSLDNVSLLYRHGLLAKALHLSVADLIALKEMTGLNPFQEVHPDPLQDTPEGVEPARKAIELDYPFSQTLRFVEVAAEVKESGLPIEDLDYLLRHRFDESGKYRASDERAMGLVKELAEGIRSIRAEHAVPADPGAMTEDELRQKLGSILAPAVVERLWAMLSGTAEFTVTRPGVGAADQLQPTSFVGSLAISQVAYDETRQEQKLVFRGVLFDRAKAELNERHRATLTAGQRATLSALLDAVQVEAAKQANNFFAKHLQEQALSASATAGFLKTTDFNTLFEPLPTIGQDLPEDRKVAARKANDEMLREKRALLARTFLPFLQRHLIRQLVVQTLTAASGADATLVESLLLDKTLLVDPIQDSRPLLDAFAASGERGVSATFFTTAEPSEPIPPSVALSDADTGCTDSAGRAIKPPGTRSVRFEGHLEVPTTGAYRFYAELDKQNGEAEFRFSHLPTPVFSGKAVRDLDQLGKGATEFVELKAGVPYRFRLDFRELGGGDGRLFVQGETLPKDRLGRLTLYPESSVQRAARAQTLLTKTLRLVQTLGLNERELRYILSHASDFAGANLSRLPTRQGDNSPSQERKLFQQFLRLASYARLKRQLVGGGDDLIDILEAAQTASLDEVYARIAAVSRRETGLVRETAETLFETPTFVDERNLWRLWEALQLVEALGVPVASMAGWSKLLQAPATAQDEQRRAAISREMKESIKARFAPETWLRVAQPIFDRLRQRRRDALVAHVMHQHGFDRLEQLFEYFLIDPGVEPAVRTSRIRSAIGAVQIFTNRCLLNLEPRVSAAAIHSKQWAWMKRYPVWAGNRKLWLFPENVLEPEFRDDKTHLFSELEGKLLQNDVNNDVAEDAFFNYLKKLDELARLDIVAMYCEEQPLDPASNQLHVIGRTYSEPHKYFYRRYAHQMWTPWQPMPIEIEGDHLVPVVWRDRLNLFWVTFMDRADPDDLPSDASDLVAAGIRLTPLGAAAKEKAAIFDSKSPKSARKVTELSALEIAGGVASASSRKLVDVQLHWSEHFQGEWSVRESGGYSASLTSAVSLQFDRAKVFIHATKDFEEGEERGVKIHLGGEINKAFSVVSRNSLPTRAPRETEPPMPYRKSAVKANRYSGNGAFKVAFTQRIETTDGKTAQSTATPDILAQGGEFTILPCANTINLASAEIASLVTPVFYQDNRSNTFFVEPTFREKTIEEWQEWVTRTPEPEVEWDGPAWWDQLNLKALSPKAKVAAPVNAADPIWRFGVDGRARFGLADRHDWLSDTATYVQFDDELIGPTGRAGLAVKPLGEAMDAGQVGAVSINANPGSDVAPGSALVATSPGSLAAAALVQPTGVNIVGGSGLNSALLKTLVASKQ